MPYPKIARRLRRPLRAVAAVAVLAAAAPAAAQLRIATWNISNYTGGRDAQLHSAVYGVNPDNGLSMGPDVLVLQEMITAGAVFDLRDILNAAPESPGDWAAAPFIDGNDTDSGLLYRTGAVEFLGLTVVSQGGPPPNPPRNVMRYDVKVLDAADEQGTIAVYSSHMKSGSDPGDRARRLLEAEIIREDAGSLPAGWHFLLGGDFNIPSSGEQAYQELVGSLGGAPGRFVDPIKRPGDWQNNSSFRFVHTQDPAGSGGMDDRYDQILVSENLVDDVGVEYIGNANVSYSGSTWDDPNHSYRSWGNDGGSFNSALRVEGNTMVGPEIAQALIDVAIGSGHLPVFLDLDPEVPPTCFADVDGDGEVGVLDMLAVLAAWGPCVGCPEDLDDDNAVTVVDFLFVLANWGPC